MIRPRITRDRVFAVFYACLVVFTAITVVWTMRQGWAVYKLRRGVGDTWFYSADGRPWFRMDEQRRDVSLDEISPDLRNAIVAVEDHRFYHHVGIDPIGLGRAVWRDVRGGRLEGGSTLTQQLARTLFLSNKRTLGRKAQEAVLWQTSRQTEMQVHPPPTKDGSIEPVPGRGLPVEPRGHRGPTGRTAHSPSLFQSAPRRAASRHSVPAGENRKRSASRQW